MFGAIPYTVSLCSWPIGRGSDRRETFRGEFIYIFYILRALESMRVRYVLHMCRVCVNIYTQIYIYIVLNFFFPQYCTSPEVFCIRWWILLYGWTHSTRDDQKQNVHRSSTRWTANRIVAVRYYENYRWYFIGRKDIVCSRREYSMIIAEQLQMLKILGIINC